MLRPGMLAIAVGLTAAFTFAACADDATDDGGSEAPPTTAILQLRPGETLPANEPRAVGPFRALRCSLLQPSDQRSVVARRRGFRRGLDAN